MIKYYSLYHPLQCHNLIYPFKIMKNKMLLDINYLEMLIFHFPGLPNFKYCVCINKINICLHFEIFRL